MRRPGVLTLALLAACGAPIPRRPPDPHPTPGPPGPNRPELPAQVLLRLPRTAGAPASLLRLGPESGMRVEPIDPAVAILEVTAAGGEVLAVTASAPADSSIAVAGCAVPVAPSGTVLDVPGRFATIQAAVDAARPGDTVGVAPGTYRERVRLRSDVRLLGAGAGRTLLVGDGQPGNLIDYSGASGVVIAGFTLANQLPGPSCGDNLDECQDPTAAGAIFADGHDDPSRPLPVGCPGASALIMHNAFEGNFVGVRPGFLAVAVVRNNVFANNHRAYFGDRVNVAGAVMNNVFWESEEAAIKIAAGFVSVVDNLVIGSGTGFAQEFGQQGTIAGNLFWKNTTLESSEFEQRIVLGVDGNVEGKPFLVDPSHGDFHLAPESPARDAAWPGTELDPDGSAADLGAYGGPAGLW